jgi:UDPglucose 6-dehydrogenase
VQTEWNEFRNLDLQKLENVMRGDILLDTRNSIDPEAAVSNGLSYLGRGRGISIARREVAVLV